VYVHFAARALRWQWLARLPDPARRRSFPESWPAPNTDTPSQLRTVPGIWRDTAAEERAFAEGPQYGFFALYTAEMISTNRYMWSAMLPSIPRRQRMGKRMDDVLAAQPPSAPPSVDPHALTDELRAEARRIGLSAVGFAPYDPKYMFAEALETGTTVATFAGRTAPIDEGSVIVCILEQDWEKTQQIPRAKSEREVFRTYEGMVDRAAALAQILQQKGFRADVHGIGGAGAYIHYAVEAGLGQLGLNGQLLTPQAGSRCRITLITTNADLVHGGPVDYGIHAICDACQVCVRRCPPGAIPKQRSYHRGVLKAKIKPDRCLPILAQAHGCAICMKVCPVQRYGLDAVKDHYVETGEILGKGTDELEGFDWIDGRHYGPDQKPRMSEHLLHPGGLTIDTARKAPLTAPQPNADLPV
jgi:epoxyqueuosine reductase